MRSLKLLKVLIQPVFILDDSENGLSEITTEQPIIITAQQWKDYPSQGFIELEKQFKDQVKAT